MKFLRTGIIAEFNPLHLGHKYIIDHVKNSGDTAVIAMSGNFVQRGGPAVYPKSLRVKAAIDCGADIVLELPVSWAMSTAQNFALGAVTQLKRAGCKKIVFGSESADIERLYHTADILLSEDFNFLVKSEIKKGVTFAKARENAAKTLGADFKLLSSPNDNLGIEYIIAAKKSGYDIAFECVKRLGAMHDEKSEHEFKSGSQIRDFIISGDINSAKAAMPESSHFLLSTPFADEKLLERAILAVLREKDADYFSALPDISEGLDRLFFTAVRKSGTISELTGNLKSKRYTLARIRRLIFSAFLGLDNEFFLKKPPYLRILGFNKKTVKKPFEEKPDCPVLSKAADIEKLNRNCKMVFGLEAKAADLYALAFKNPHECGLEYKYKIYKGE